MTEAEWMECTDPRSMLRFLRDRGLQFERARSGRTAGRRMRLFACACCRSLWHLLTENCGRKAVEVAERYADGQAMLHDLREAYGLVVWGRDESILQEQGRRASNSEWLAARVVVIAVEDYRLLPSVIEQAGAAGLGEIPGAAYPPPLHQCMLLRDIFRPFRMISLDPAWRRWNGGTVIHLARAIYDRRSFQELPILADSLEDAGCTNDEILGHLRGPGPHARGCWAVDLLLDNK